MDAEKCWEQIDKVIAVLHEGFKYLTTEQIPKLFQNDAVYDDPSLEYDEKQFADALGNALQNQNKSSILRS